MGGRRGSPRALILINMTIFFCLIMSSLSAAEETPGMGTLKQEQPLGRHKRLTTFGKSPSQQSPQIPTSGRGRECKSDADCEAVLYTTCSADRDGKRRCLCKDHNPPVNGQCQVKPRGLRQSCNQDSECLEGAECKIDRNSTTHPRGRICVCRPGFVELGNQCSGGVSLMNLSPSMALATLSVILFAARTFLNN